MLKTKRCNAGALFAAGVALLFLCHRQYDWVVRGSMEVVGYSAVRGRTPLKPTRKLRQWGFPKCDWLLRTGAEDELYPQKLPVYAGGEDAAARHRRKSPLYQCAKRLTDLTEEGRAFFWIDGGQALRARLSGSSNLKSDDFDMDIGLDHMLYKYPTYSDYGRFAKWVCPDTSLDANVAFRFFGEEEFDTHAREVAAVSRAGAGAVAVAGANVQARCDSVHYLSTFCDVEPHKEGTPPATFCRAEYEGLEILINMQWNNGDRRHRDKLVDEFGASYWVPLSTGGKNAGLFFERYFYPRDGEGWSSLFAWPEWLEALHRGYKEIGGFRRGGSTAPGHGQNRDRDSEISMQQLSTFVMSHPKVNEKWLRRIAVEHPCVLVNAQIHANHTLFFSSLGLELRAGCQMSCDWRDKCEEKHPEAWLCQKHQANVFASRWQTLSYLDSTAECADILLNTGFFSRSRMPGDDNKLHVATLLRPHIS
jgi:hypothetical protein